MYGRQHNCWHDSYFASHTLPSLYCHYCLLLMYTAASITFFPSPEGCGTIGDRLTDRGPADMLFVRALYMMYLHCMLPKPMHSTIPFPSTYLFFPPFPHLFLLPRNPFKIHKQNHYIQIYTQRPKSQGLQLLFIRAFMTWPNNIWNLLSQHHPQTSRTLQDQGRVLNNVE